LFVIHDLQHTSKHTFFQHSSQWTDCTEQVEACHTLLLGFHAPLSILRIPAFPFDRTQQQHSP